MRNLRRIAVKNTHIPIYEIISQMFFFLNKGHPIMPLAVNIHERQFKSSHSLFWARVVGDIPALQVSYHFYFINS